MLTAHETVAVHPCIVQWPQARVDLASSQTVLVTSVGFGSNSLNCFVIHFRKGVPSSAGNLRIHTSYTRSEQHPMQTGGTTIKKQLSFSPLVVWGGACGEGGVELLISDEIEKNEPLHPTHPNLTSSSLRCTLNSEKQQRGSSFANNFFLFGNRGQFSKQSLPWGASAVRVWLIYFTM